MTTLYLRVANRLQLIPSVVAQHKPARARKKFINARVQEEVH